MKTEKHIKLTRTFFSVALAASCYAVVAGPLTIPNTFSDGDTLTASGLNGNFNAIATEVTGNANDLSSHSGNASAHHSRYTDAEVNAVLLTAGIDGNSLNAADGNPADVVIVDNDGRTRVNGSAGIGVDPVWNFDVAGTMTSTGGLTVGGTPGARGALVEFKNTIPWGTVLRVSNNAGTTQFSISNSGTVVVGNGAAQGGTLFYVAGAAGGTTTWANLSDGKLKTNVKDLNNALEKIMQLRSVSYEWDLKKYPNMNFSKGQNIGFIAQEVKQVVPEAVSGDEKNLLSMSYSTLVPVLVKAMQQQQAEIEQLRKEAEAMKDVKIELMELRAMMTSIKQKQDESLLMTSNSR